MRHTALPYALAVLAAALGLPNPASAYVVSIAARNPRAVYLRVGDGAMSGGYYETGGTPAIDPTVNRVQVSVPANAVGNGTSLAMSTEGSPRLSSDYDGFLFCNPGQIYVGGFFRRTGGAIQTARLMVSAPSHLVSADGHTIPISQISWTTSGNGETGTQPIPAGTLSAGETQLATFPRNSWRESCMSFRYANQNLVAAGTYDAAVTFTLAQP